MTIPEIVDTITCRNRRSVQRQKEKLELLHFLAKDIAQVFASDKDHPAQELWDMFPALFTEEKEAAEQLKSEHEAARYKARMVDYAIRHNARRGGG